MLRAQKFEMIENIQDNLQLIGNGKKYSPNDIFGVIKTGIGSKKLDEFI